MQERIPTPSRRSIRLRHFDYRQAGYYFLTLCTDQRRNLFGYVFDDSVRLSALGELAAMQWLALPEHFAYASLDAFVVMPNHVHGIVQLLTELREVDRTERFGAPCRGSIATLVRSYKAAVTRQARLHATDSRQVVWQRNYWERVIRDEAELLETRRYIENNPQQWMLDRLYCP